MGRSSSPKVSGRGRPDIAAARQRGIERGVSPLASEPLRGVARYDRAQLATFRK